MIEREQQEAADLDPLVLTALSKSACSQIAKTALAGTSQPICHHFGSKLNWADRSTDDDFLEIQNTMQELGLEFSINGLEAWEHAVVDAAWIGRRPWEVKAAAESAGFTYSGWSWEPKGHTLISATGFVMADCRGVPNA